MASLALLVSIIVLFTLFFGPIVYLMARLEFPKLIVDILSVLCIGIGISFCLIPVPVWYIGFVPIYFGYISIIEPRQKKIKG